MHSEEGGEINVFLTMDVEIWCDGWDDIDRKFPSAFDKYVYGVTPKGRYGLPYQLDLLRDHGLLATCFVEPLFSARFGNEPLAEIVGLIDERDHEIQAHLHTEWVDEALTPLIPDNSVKRQHLFMFTIEEQVELIGRAIAMLRNAGAPPINAFRAGSFGFNNDTLRALAKVGVDFDSSYNTCMYGPESGVMPDIEPTDPFLWEGVWEYPMTTFRDGVGRMRPAQLTSCSWKELESLLWQAVELNKNSFVFLFHNFEVLNPAKNRLDDVVDRRLRKLCRFLDRNRDVFRVRGFRNLSPDRPVENNKSLMLKTGLFDTGLRILEQAWRRRYARRS